MTEEKAKRYEWKTKALRYILLSQDWANSPYRQEREYAGYVKQFFFGSEEITFDGNNETWQSRKERLELPMSVNAYLYM